MKPTILTLAAIVGAAGMIAAQKPPAASNLPPAPPSGAGLETGQCLRSHEIRGHTVVDKQTMLLGSNQREVYRVTFKGACLAGAVSSDPIITETPPGSQLVCRPIDLDIAISKGGFAMPCIVDSIAKLTPEQASALPRRLRP
jgi:Family of unknown function (DUF6491)